MAYLQQSRPPPDGYTYEEPMSTDSPTSPERRTSPPRPYSIEDNPPPPPPGSRFSLIEDANKQTELPPRKNNTVATALVIQLPRSAVQKSRIPIRMRSYLFDPNANPASRSRYKAKPHTSPELPDPSRRPRKPKTQTRSNDSAWTEFSVRDLRSGSDVERPSRQARPPLVAQASDNHADEPQPVSRGYVAPVVVSGPPDMQPTRRQETRTDTPTLLVPPKIPSHQQQGSRRAVAPRISKHEQQEINRFRRGQRSGKWVVPRQSKQAVRHLSRFIARELLGSISEETPVQIPPPNSSPHSSESYTPTYVSFPRPDIFMSPRPPLWPLCRRIPPYTGLRVWSYFLLPFLLSLLFIITTAVIMVLTIRKHQVLNPRMVEGMWGAFGILLLALLGCNALLWWKVKRKKSDQDWINYEERNSWDSQKRSFCGYLGDGEEWVKNWLVRRADKKNDRNLGPLVPYTPGSPKYHTPPLYTPNSPKHHTPPPIPPNGSSVSSTNRPNGRKSFIRPKISPRGSSTRGTTRGRRRKPSPKDRPDSFPGPKSPEPDDVPGPVYPEDSPDHSITAAPTLANDTRPFSQLPPEETPAPAPSEATTPVSDALPQQFLGRDGMLLVPELWSRTPPVQKPTTSSDTRRHSPLLGYLSGSITYGAPRLSTPDLHHSADIDIGPPAPACHPPDQERAKFWEQYRHRGEWMQEPREDDGQERKRNSPMKESLEFLEWRRARREMEESGFFFGPKNEGGNRRGRKKLRAVRAVGGDE